MIRNPHPSGRGGILSHQRRFGPICLLRNLSLRGTIHLPAEAGTNSSALGSPDPNSSRLLQAFPPENIPAQTSKDTPGLPASDLGLLGHLCCLLLPVVTLPVQSPTTALPLGSQQAPTHLPAPGNPPSALLPPHTLSEPQHYPMCPPKTLPVKLSYQHSYEGGQSLYLTHVSASQSQSSTDHAESTQSLSHI